MHIETRHIVARAQAPYRDRDGTEYFSLTCPVCGYAWAQSPQLGTRQVRTAEPHPDHCLYEVMCVGGQMDMDALSHQMHRVYPMHRDAAGRPVLLRLVFWDREEDV